MMVRRNTQLESHIGSLTTSVENLEQTIQGLIGEVQRLSLENRNLHQGQHPALINPQAQNNQNPQENNQNNQTHIGQPPIPPGAAPQDGNLPPHEGVVPPANDGMDIQDEPVGEGAVPAAPPDVENGAPPAPPRNRRPTGATRRTRATPRQQTRNNNNNRNNQPRAPAPPRMPQGNDERRVEEVLRTNYVPDVPSKLPKTMVDLWEEYERKNLAQHRNNKRGWESQYIARFDRWDYLYRQIESTATNARCNPLVVMTDLPR
jgi:hypothetical protein